MVAGGGDLSPDQLLPNKVQQGKARDPEMLKIVANEIHRESWQVGQGRKHKHEHRIQLDFAITRVVCKGFLVQPQQQHNYHEKEKDSKVLHQGNSSIRPRKG